MIKSIIFRENFMKALNESASNFKGYDLLIKKLNRYKNPISFYNFIKNSDVFSDIFLYYKRGEGLTYGNFKGDEDRFNYGLEELGIVEEEKKKLLKRYSNLNGSENEQNFYNKIKNISEAEDLFEILRVEEK